MITGLVWDERLMCHDTGLYFGPSEGSPRVNPLKARKTQTASGALRICLTDPVLPGG